MLNVKEIREQFPILKRQVGGRPVVFADSGATSLKPLCVIRAVEHYYTQVCANVHRGVNIFAEEADALYEAARRSVAEFLNAKPEEIIFTRNTTEGINLAAHILNLAPEDEVVCTLTNHHSNFLPWMARCQARVVPPDADGMVTPEMVLGRVTPRTKLIAISHVANITGLPVPVEEIIRAARARGIRVVLDGAQSVTHMPIDVRALDCDFLAFSGHKMLGPSGIGVLYARKEILEKGAPMLFGGGMVASATAESFQIASAPRRYEAGTPNIEGAIGLGAAANFLMDLGMDNVHEHNRKLAAALARELNAIPRLTPYPRTAVAERLPIFSFSLDGLSVDDAAVILCNRYNIMIRSGVHCAEPLVRHIGQKGLARISLYLYNTEEEVAYIGDSLRKLCASLS